MHNFNINLLICGDNDIIINNKIYSTLSYKFNIINWFSQNAIVDFCKLPVSVANLCLQFMNTYSPDINVGWYFLLLSGVRQKQNTKIYVRNSL